MSKLIPTMLFIMFSFLLNTSCQKQNQETDKKEVKVVSLQKTKKLVKTRTVLNSGDDFSDFEKKEEKCDSEEELLKKQFEKKSRSKTQTIKLQGGNDSGCTVN
jgi:hypothetical protein